MAVKVTSYTPSCPAAGVHSSVPEVRPEFVVKTAPTGVGSAVSEVMTSASGSVTETSRVNGLPTTAEAVAGAVTIGG